MTPVEIRQWRADHKFSPHELANALGVARNTIYRWESGSMAAEDTLAERLTMVLAKREASKADTPRPLFRTPGNTPIMESRQPHGTVISLTQSFWVDMTDQERVDWIMTAKNPLLGIGWPNWSHGYDERPRGRPQDHYLIQEFMGELTARMTMEKGTEQERLRRACVYVMRKNTPTWLGNKRDTPDQNAYAALKDLMENYNE
jgi:DNA-binding XRE family transcriptional regulator